MRPTTAQQTATQISIKKQMYYDRIRTNYMSDSLQRLKGQMERDSRKYSINLSMTTHFGRQSKRAILSNLRVSGAKHRHHLLASGVRVRTMRLDHSQQQSTHQSVTNLLLKLGYSTER